MRIVRNVTIFAVLSMGAAAGCGSGGTDQPDAFVPPAIDARVPGIDAADIDAAAPQPDAALPDAQLDASPPDADLTPDAQLAACDGLTIAAEVMLAPGTVG